MRKYQLVGQKRVRNSELLFYGVVVDRSDGFDVKDPKKK